MRRTRVKICGLTRPDDVQAAARAGADALGFVFYEPSPRAVTAAQAARLVTSMPAFVTSVGLFVDPEPDLVASVLRQVPLDLLQFHGDESPEFCASFGRPFIKAVRVTDGVDLAAEAARFRDARALLVDAFVPGIPGGTGQTLDWSLLPPDLPLPLVLAGGLEPGNVAQAIAEVRPWAVDVSGGVEECDAQGQRQPGLKSADAIHAFMRGVISV